MQNETQNIHTHTHTHWLNHQKWKKKTTKNEFAHAATSSSAPSSPKEQPQSLSSSGNDSETNAADGESADLDNNDKSLTNGKSATITDSADTGNAEPSYQNNAVVAAVRASRANASHDAEYENTANTSESNGLNGSASGSIAVNNNNNNNNAAAASELVNGNATDAAKKLSADAASKEQLYDVPVGEWFAIYPPLILLRHIPFGY